MRPRGLIGYTGFVGSTLWRSGAYDVGFNRANAAAMAGQEFAVLCCAGLPAAKWLANADPAADWANVQQLQNTLQQVRAHRFVLISTVDVYPDPAAAPDEATSINRDGHHAYGCHRYQFEQWCAGHFSDCWIIRLPGLFGPGLKKNVLYDLLHRHQLEKINPAGSFQWYPIGQLAADLAVMQREEIRLLNMTTPPLTVAEIAARFFPDRSLGPTGAGAAYDIRSQYAPRWGGINGYCHDRAWVWQELAAWIRAPEQAGV